MDDNNLKFKFLEDKPIEVDELEFGHESIAEALNSIVQNINTDSLTIGLYGKWGTGKTSISKKLKVKLDKVKIPLILFDVWKHEGDALRRTFLKVLIEQLKESENKYIDKNYILDDRIDRNTTKVDEIYSIAIDKLLKHLIIVLIFSGLISVPFLLLFFLFNKAFNLNVLSNLISVESISYLLSSTIGAIFSFKYGKQFIKTQLIYTNEDKFHDPIDFEDEFKRVLKNLNADKIVIAFDNIDRVSGENAVKIISTIKTFLEPKDKDGLKKNILFVIPCDEQAVKNHLSGTYITENVQNKNFDTTQYADEFLRKFFNTIIRIPDFHFKELEKYALKKLNDTIVPQLKDNETASWLISRAYRDNPRQIIQFINTIVSNLILAHERCKTGEFDYEFLNQHTNQLIKYLIIQQKCPDLIEFMKQKKIYTLDAYREEDVRNEFIEISTNNNHKIQLETILKFDEETNPVISINNYRPFLTLKKHEGQKQMPEVEIMFEHLKDRKVDDALMLANQMQLIKNLKLFCDNIDAELEDMNNSTTICSFIDTLFEVTKSLEIKLHGKAYIAIGNKLRNVNESFYSIKPKLIEKEFLSKHLDLTKPIKNKILHKYLYLVREEKENLNQKIADPAIFFDEVFDILFSYGKLLSKKELKIAIDRNFSEESWLHKKILADKALIKMYMSGKIYESLVNNISISNFENYPDNKVDSILSIDTDFLSEEGRIAVLQKLHALNHEENKIITEDRNEIKFNLSVYSILLIRKLGKTLEDSNDKSEGKLSAALNKYFLELINTNIDAHIGKWWCVPQLFAFEKYLSGNVIMDARNFTDDYVSRSNNNEAFKLTLNILKHENVSLLEDFIYTRRKLIFDSTPKNPDRFDIVYKHLNDKLKAELLINLFSDPNGQFRVFWNRSKNLKFNIPFPELVSNAILKRISSDVLIDYRLTFLEHINEYKLSKEEFNSNEFKIILSEILKEYVTDKNHGESIVQIITTSKHLTKKEKEDLLFNTASDWIKLFEQNKEKIAKIITYPNVPKSFINKFYKEYSDKLNNYIIELRLFSFFKNLSFNLNQTNKKTLITNIAVKLYLKITPPDEVSAIKYEMLLEDYFHLINLKLFKFSGLNQLVSKLVCELLKHGRHQKVHEIVINFLIKLKDEGTKFPENINNAIHQLYKSPTISPENILLVKKMLSPQTISQNYILQSISKQNGKDDQIIEEKFDLLKYRYEIEVKLKEIIDYWRFGIQLSKGNNFFPGGRRYEVNYPLIHLTKDFEEPSLYITYYEQQNSNKHQLKNYSVYKNYENQIIKILLHRKGDNICIDFFDSRNRKKIDTFSEFKDLRYFKPFAWADGKSDFEIDVKINEIIDVPSGT